MRNTLLNKTSRSLTLAFGCVIALTYPARSASFIPTTLTNPTFSPSTVSSTLTDPQTLSRLLNVPVPVIDYSEGIYQEINSGSLSSQLTGFGQTFGALGLIDPAFAGQQSWSEAIDPGSQSPYGNPQTPTDYYTLGKYSDTVASQIPQQLSQAIFSPHGQQVQQQQSQQVQQAQQTALAGQQGASDTYDASVKQAQQNANDANAVGDEADVAAQQHVTQKVMQAIAQQNYDMANIQSGLVNQLANQNKSAALQSGQLYALSNQVTALYQQSQLSNVLQASQNYQMSQAASTLQAQSDYQQNKDFINSDAAHRTWGMTYIPGLVPKDGSNVTNP